MDTQHRQAAAAAAAAATATAISHSRRAKGVPPASAQWGK